MTITQEKIADLVAEMDKSGFAVLPDYLEKAELEELQQFVRRRVAAAGGQYVVFTGKQAVAGTLPSSLRQVRSSLYYVASTSKEPISARPSKGCIKCCAV